MDSAVIETPAPSHNGADIEAATALLRALFDEQDQILFRPIETWIDAGTKRSKVDYKNTTHRDATPRSLFFTLRHQLAVAERARANLFFGVCPRFGGKGRFDLAWQIRTVRTLWADIDHMTIDEVRERLAKSGLPEPSIVVNSGHGAHLYWKLAEPYLIDNADDPPAVEGKCDPDEVPEPPDAAVTQPGDLWILGEHRLLCGDSSKPDELDRLLNGNLIHLCNTDPPYNVKVEPRSNNAIAAGLSSFQGTTHHQGLDVARHPEKSKPTGRKLRAKDRPLANDFVSDEAFDGLLDAWFGNIARVLAPGRAFYIWGGYANLGNYPPFLKKHGLYFSQGIVWDKQHPVFGVHAHWCPADGSPSVPHGARRSLLRCHRRPLPEVHRPGGRAGTDR